MKYLLTCIFLLAATSFLAAQTFHIQGNIELDKGELLVLTQQVEGMDTLAQTKFENNRFALTGNLQEPVVALLKIAGYEGGFVMILEPGMEYTAKLTRNGAGDIRGGKLQDIYNDYQKIVADANAESRALNKKASEAAAQKHFKTSHELKAKANKVQQAAFDKMNNIVRKNADNVLAAYLQTAGSERIMELEPLKQIYSLLSEKAKETAPGKLLEARIADLEKVGIAATAPDFTLTTPEGKQVSLYSVKGKLKIIDFWASWCGPCRMENPNMVKLYNDFKDKGLAIVSVSLDERKVPWVQAIKKDGMPWTHVSSLKGWKCEVVKQYNIDAVPSIIVLDENNLFPYRKQSPEKEVVPKNEVLPKKSDIKLFGSTSLCDGAALSKNRPRNQSTKTTLRSIEQKSHG